MSFTFSNRFLDHFKEVARTKTSPRSIAFGFSLGTFISILPTTGFGFIIGLLIVALFKRISKYGLFLAMLIWNPITVAPVYVLSYQIGDWLVVKESGLPLDWIEQFIAYSQTFMVGNILVNMPITIFSYFTIYYLVVFYQSKNEQ